MTIKPGRILVVAPNWLGDSIMAQPLLTLLKSKAPTAPIDVVAVPAVAPVFRRMPEVSGVIEADFRHGSLDFRARWKLGRSLKQRYVQSYTLPNSWKSALVPFFADVPVRVGYAGEARVGLIDLRHANPKKGGPRESMTRFYARLADLPGKHDDSSDLAQPFLVADPLRVIAAKVNLGLKPAESLIALCPGAEYGPAKRWPADYFAEVAGKLKARGHTPIILGGANDVPTGLTIEQLSSGAALNLAGKTSLDDAINLIAGSRAVITNDSGLMHVAAALGKPQIALFGSSSPEHTPPQSDAARVVWLKVDCSPCFARECPLGHFRCLRELTPDRVLGEFDALGDLLTSSPT